MIKALKRYLTFLLVILFLPASKAAESRENIKIGKKIYTEQCVLCHGPAGEGWDWKKKAAMPPVPVPNLLEVLPGRSDEYLATVIKFGGSAVGLTDFMPALGFNLTDQELRNLITYLRKLMLKPSANGAFLEKSTPPQSKNLVLFPRMGRTLSSRFSSLLISSAFIRPSAVFFSEKNYQTNWLFNLKLEQESFLLAHQQKNSGNHKTGGFFPHAITLGDYNNDGNTDFAIPWSASRKVTILLGDGKVVSLKTITILLELDLPGLPLPI